MIPLPPGVTGGVTGPTTYTMYYPMPVTYTEPFAIINCSPYYVASIGNDIVGVIQSIAGFLSAIPVVGPALGAIVELGSLWYGTTSLNSDGSVSFYFAYHYCGTKIGGVDLTAIPVVGPNKDIWQQIVNSLIQAMGQYP